MSGPKVRHGTQARNYYQHLRNVEKAMHKVDNAAPRLPIAVYIKDAGYYADMTRLRQLEEHNREMLKHINIVYRTKGKVDCELERYNRQKTTYDQQLKQLQHERNKIIHFLERLDLKHVKSQYNQTDFLKDWKKIVKAMRFKAKYPEFYDKKPSHLEAWSPCPSGVVSDPDQRQVCFLDLKIGDLPRSYRVEIEVYSDIVPATAANFVSLCQGFGALSYKESPFHRIIPGLLCIGGDIVNHSGTGGMSIYGPSFPAENFTLQHNGPGVVAMYSSQHETNNSQFLITFKKLTTLNGKYVVIGRVKSSYSILRMMECCGTKGGKPLQTVKVLNCGVYGGAGVRRDTFPAPEPTATVITEP